MVKTTSHTGSNTDSVNGRPFDTNYKLHTASTHINKPIITLA